MNKVSILFLLFILLSFADLCTSAPGDAYGLISDVQTECEYEALYVGSRLGDAYNSYDETVLPIDRIQHDFFRRIPLFSRLIQYELSRHTIPGYHLLPADVSTAGIAASDHNSNTHSKKQFKGDDKFHHEVTHSAFKAFANKWIHFIGDATLKTWLHTVILPFHGRFCDFRLVNDDIIMIMIMITISRSS